MTAKRVLGLALLASAPAAWAQQPSALNTRQTAKYIGSEACKTCHPDVWSKFYRNPHFKSLSNGKEPPEHTGCESCHGPGGAHVAAHGGKATIIAF